jgi:hypothetical protein
MIQQAIWRQPKERTHPHAEVGRLAKGADGAPGRRGAALQLQEALRTEQ